MADQNSPGGLPKEKIVSVYGKDLYSDRFTVRVRIPAEGFEHGDKIKITAERIEEEDAE